MIGLQKNRGRTRNETLIGSVLHQKKQGGEPNPWDVQRMRHADKIHQREEKEGVLFGQM